MHRSLSLPPLTDVAIRDAVPASKDRFIQDGALPELWLRIYPHGVKVFVLRYREVDRRRVQARLGTWPEMTLEAARKEASRRLTVVGAGIPLAAVRLTFRTVAEAYLEARVSPACEDATLAEYRRCLERDIYPRLGDKLMRGIRTKDLLKVLQPFTGQPTWNRMLKGLLRPICAFAVRLRYADTNEASEIAEIEETPRYVELTEAELARLRTTTQALAEKGKIQQNWADIVMVMLATGCRPGEVLSLTPAQVDRVHQLIHFGRHKTRRRSGPKFIPLTPLADELLQRREPRDPAEPYFPGRRGTALKSIAKAFRKIRALAGLPWLHAHDLRHVFGTKARALSDPLVAADLLGLKTVDMVVTYTRAPQEELRRVSEATARWMLGKDACITGNALVTDGQMPGALSAPILGFSATTWSWGCSFPAQPFAPASCGSNLVNEKDCPVREVRPVALASLNLKDAIREAVHSGRGKRSFSAEDVIQHLAPSLGWASGPSPTHRHWVPREGYRLGSVLGT